MIPRVSRCVARDLTLHNPAISQIPLILISLTKQTLAGCRGLTKVLWCVGGNDAGCLCLRGNTRVVLTLSSYPTPVRQLVCSLCFCISASYRAIHWPGKQMCFCYLNHIYTIPEKHILLFVVLYLKTPLMSLLIDTRVNVHSFSKRTA